MGERKRKRKRKRKREDDGPDNVTPPGPQLIPLPV